MNPSTARVVMFRKRLLVQSFVFGAATFLIQGLLVLSSAQSSTEERTFKHREFRDMPLRVRKVKNLQSETWPNDLEIEIENVSTKPIYFIHAVLEFPDDPAPNGGSGITLEYGSLENMDIARIAEEKDEHLDPGKTVALVVSDKYKKGLLAKQRDTPDNMKRLDFWFHIISFGDGTGFEVSQFLDLRKRKASFEAPRFHKIVVGQEYHLTASVAK